MPCSSQWPAAQHLPHSRPAVSAPRQLYPSHGDAQRPLAWRRAAAASEEPAALQESTPEPEDARGAIAVGLKLFNSGQYQEALDIFEKALKLPGTGVKRFRSVHARLHRQDIAEAALRPGPSESGTAPI